MDEKKTCPSATCTEGSQLIGIINQKHEFNFLKVPLTVTKPFIEQAVKHGSPEKRFRFASKCVQSGCNQWTGIRCGVSDHILESIESSLHKTDLPDCAIRATCRWFFQNGELACRVCPLVTTDSL
jgi:hypothetical protein